ncbi:MAG: hydrogen peroxide-inducible genes activator, partial [Rhizobiaceae bacterium]
VALIPEMAVAIETRSAAVSIARFKPPRPARTIGMIWRRSSPLAGQLGRIAEVVKRSAEG